MALTPEGFAAACNVSRETLSRLRSYAEILRKWQRAINLVAAESMADLWRRHMLDSAQLFPLLPSLTRNLVDLGSGAGFPGLVLAILGVGEVHLIESDTRKCLFLAEAARAVGLDPGRNPVIHCARIQDIRNLKAGTVTARACAALTDLLAYATPYLRDDSICLFLKGAKVEDELIAARRDWNLTVERIPSRSDPSGTILRLSGVAGAGL